MITVGRKSDSYSMHPVVQAWCREHLQENDQEEMRTIALILIGSIVPLKSEMGDGRFFERESFFKYKDLRLGLLPHTAQILQWLQKNWCFHLSNITLHSAFRLGCFYKDISDFREGEVIFQQALASWWKTQSPDYMKPMAFLLELGNVYREQSKLMEAKIAFEEILTGYKRWGLSDTDGFVLNAINGLGGVYSDLGDFDEAERLYKQALTGFGETLGHYHVSTLENVRNLAVFYTRRRRFEEAEMFFRQALIGSEKTNGLNSMSTLSIVFDFGRFYLYQGNLAEAEAMFQQAFTVYKRFGLHSTFTIDA